MVTALQVSSTTTAHAVLGFLGMPGGWEWIALLLLGLLIFGRNLPSVGRNLGQGIVEFKKGLSGIGDDVNRAADEGSQSGDSKSSGQAGGERSDPKRLEGEKADRTMDRDRSETADSRR